MEEDDPLLSSPQTEPAHNVVTTCDPHEPIKFLEIRYYLIGVFGLLICVVGIVMNAFLFYILLRPSLRNTYLIYLSVLALLDIAVNVTYMMLMSVYVQYEYLGNYFLYTVWHVFLPYFFTLSRVVTLASTYMVVVCTEERLLEVSQLSRHGGYQVNQTNRYVVIGLVIGLSTVLRLVVFWEIDIVQDEECKGTLMYYHIIRTWLTVDYYYNKIYSFYIMHVVQVFFPFIVLVLLNRMIIRKWRMIKTGTSDEMVRRVHCAQSARQMMVAIVTTYLVCNILNFTLTLIEHFNNRFLQQYDVAYSFAADAVSMLTIVNASFRLPVYYATNLKIRHQIRLACSDQVNMVRKIVRRMTRRTSNSDMELDKMINDCYVTGYATFEDNVSATTVKTD